MDRAQQLREIREAIDTGRLTLQYLNRARDELSAASGFGIADMLGFDLIGGISKTAGNGLSERIERRQWNIGFPD